MQLKQCQRVWFMASSALLAVGVLGGCIESRSTPCGDTVCAPGFQCDMTHLLCVLPEQLMSCVGEADEAPCTVRGETGYYCDQEVCLRSPACGNGQPDPGEECDGANLNGQDCISQGYSGGQLKCGVDCLFDTTACVSQCGNGIVDAGEGCDDNGHTDGDGCSAWCEIEPCWSCTGNPSVCQQNGTDNDRDGYGAGCALGEDCDDGAPGITGQCLANGCPQGWILVPAGVFEMGCDSGDLC